MAPPTVGTIAVMGITGSGKSSFINGVTGDQGARIGTSLRSETSDIQTFRLQTPSGIICLADTPGFDDTDRQDYEVLEQLVDWVQKSAVGGRNLAAILLLHPITQNRLQGSSRRMFSTFKKLLGHEYYKKVLLVTTFWNDAQQDVGIRREKELLDSDDGWKPIINAGARVERMSRDYKRFIPLLERMSKSSSPQLLVQKELGQGKSLSQTMAGLSLETERIEYEQQLQKLKAEMEARAAKKTTGFDQAIRRQKSMNNIVYKEEIQRHELENKRIIAQLKMEDERRQATRQQRKWELEQQLKVEREKQKERERQRKKQEREQLKRNHEVIARLQNKASLHLRDHVCEVIDMIRAYSATGMLPVTVKGIQQEGIGFFGQGASGKNENIYTVTRSGLNVWCDACQVPIGAKVQFGRGEQSHAQLASLIVTC